MSRLNIVSTVKKEQPLTISMAVSRVLENSQRTTESISTETQLTLANDMRNVITMLGESHPYLRYCSYKEFTDAELLERQTEIVAALGSGLKAAFGAISRTSSKVSNSSRFIPEWFKWTGFGNNWGTIVGGLAFMTAIDAATDKLDRATNFDAKGLSDRDGLVSKRASIPQNQKFQLKDLGWQEKEPLTTLDVADQMDRMVEFLNKLNTMTTMLPKVVSGKMQLSAWLDNLKTGTTSSAGTWIVAPLHKNVGFTVYKNGDKYFLEKVTGSKPLSKTAIIPQVKDMMWIQKAAKNMDKSAMALNKNLEKTLKKLSSENKEVSKDAAFAYRTLLTIFEDIVPLAKDMLRSGKHFVDDAIAAIVSFRTDGE